MNTKQLGILGVLAVLPALAAPRYHATMRDLVDHKDGTVTTGNWSGYAVTGSGFTKAVGSWIVPAVTCKSGDQYAVFWVGIDGYTSKTVEQTGTEATCAGGKAQYSAWYEFCCREPIITIPSMTVKPGDEMSAAISYNTSTENFTVKITDQTTGQSFTKSAKVPHAERTSAEWIAEAPSAGGVLPLANFGTVLFGKDSTGFAGTCNATDSTNSGHIGAFPGIEQITMEKNSVQESIPSALSSDGTSFSVTWAAQ